MELPTTDQAEPGNGRTPGIKKEGLKHGIKDFG
jgi:hypothetical protein